MSSDHAAIWLKATAGLIGPAEALDLMKAEAQRPDGLIVTTRYGMYRTSPEVRDCESIAEATGITRENLGRPQRLGGPCRGCGAPDDGAASCSYCTTGRKP